MTRVKIEQLFQAAKGAPAPAIEPMPTYLQTRILASCSNQGGRDLTQALATGLRLGLGVAFAVMLACVAYNYGDLSFQPDNFVELTNVEAYLDWQL